MNHFRHHRLGICLALALLILSGIMPAFAAPGTWVCPNGHACPWMNGGHPDRMSPGLQKLCKQAPSRSCCRCPVGSKPLASVKSSPECRYIPSARTHPAGQPIATKPIFKRALSPVLRPLSLEQLYRAFCKAPPDFPLPQDCSLPPPPFLSATSSRAPPPA
jgi:hypothetical protein